MIAEPFSVWKDTKGRQWFIEAFLETMGRARRVHDGSTRHVVFKNMPRGWFHCHDLYIDLLDRVCVIARRAWAGQGRDLDVGELETLLKSEAKAHFMGEDVAEVEVVYFKRLTVIVYFSFESRAHRTIDQPSAIDVMAAAVARGQGPGVR